jgi:hypothetical protein
MKREREKEEKEGGKIGLGRETRSILSDLGDYPARIILVSPKLDAALSLSFSFSFYPSSSSFFSVSLQIGSSETKGERKLYIALSVIRWYVKI